MHPLSRTLTVLVAMTSLAACSDSSPVGVPVLNGPALTNGGSGSSASSSGSGSSTTTIKLAIALTAPVDGAFIGAKGDAKFESKGTERQFEVEVEHIPAGTVVNFTLGGVKVGSATANSFGEASLTLRGAAAPLTVAGLAVAATTVANAPIASGSF